MQGLVVLVGIGAAWYYMGGEAAAIGFAILSVAGVFAAWYSRQVQIDNAATLIEQHTPELTRKRRQCTQVTDYGITDASKWSAEINRFIALVIVPKVGAINSTTMAKIRMHIDEASANYQTSRTDFSLTMDPIAYEQMVADRLADLGWSTRLTKGSGDQGIDVIAEMREKKVVIQCKLYSSPVGNSAVQEAFAGRSFEDADYAAVVTNAGYTPGARQLSEATRVMLLDHDALGDLERQIFGTEPIAIVTQKEDAVPANTPHEPMVRKRFWIGLIVFAILLLSLILLTL